jgi:hypothetical protein
LNTMLSLLPFVSGVVSFVLAGFIFKRYLARHGAHQLLWGIGTVFYGLGSWCEAYYATFGWNELAFRLWYLFGAVLVAAWLGQGTVYLLVKRKWANVLMVVLAVASLGALILVFGAKLDPNEMALHVRSGTELSGYAIITPGVRSVTPFFNIYGTVTLIGGAAWSAWIFWRKRVLLHRTIGNILIAVGAMMPAMGGAFSRMGLPGILYLGELLGIALILVGFIRATTPIENVVRVRQEASR